MAIIKRRSGQWEFFPLSLVAVSQELHDVIAEALKKKIGKGIRKITPKKIKEVLLNKKFKEVEFVGKGRILSLPLIVLDVSFTELHKYAVVTVSLWLPLKGDYGLKNEIAREVASKLSLQNVYFQNGIKAEVVLDGENLPCQIHVPSDSNDEHLFKGNGRKVFVTKKEYLSENYSPIA